MSACIEGHQKREPAPLLLWYLRSAIVPGLSLATPHIPDQQWQPRALCGPNPGSLQAHDPAQSTVGAPSRTTRLYPNSQSFPQLLLGLERKEAHCGRGYGKLAFLSALELQSRPTMQGTLTPHWLGSCLPSCPFLVSCSLSSDHKQTLFICSFFFVFRQSFLYVALVVLEITLQTRLALISQSLQACLCLLSADIKDVHYHQTLMTETLF